MWQAGSVYASYFLWTLTQSSCFLPALGVSSLDFSGVETYCVSYLSWHFQRPRRSKSCFYFFFFSPFLFFLWRRRPKIVIPTESQGGTDTWHEFLENTRLDECYPCWLSSSLLSHKAGTMEKKKVLLLCGNYFPWNQTENSSLAVSGEDFPQMRWLISLASSKESFCSQPHVQEVSVQRCGSLVKGSI